MLTSNRDNSTGEAMPFPEASKHPWFAIRVKSNHEKAVCTYLAVKGFEVFLPICRTRNRWADRFKLVERPLFGGYVFSRLDRTRPNAVLSTPGVLQIVGSGPASRASARRRNSGHPARRGRQLPTARVRFLREGTARHRGERRPGGSGGNGCELEAEVAPGSFDFPAATFGGS